MPPRIVPTTRLCLVTPTAPAHDFPVLFDRALASGDIASAIVAPLPSGEPDEAMARQLAPIATRRGTALLLAGDSDAASRLDGVHVETGLVGLRTAIARHQPDRIVGVGAVHSRHDAMEFGEAGADYLFFGRLDGDTAPGIHSSALDLAAWWAELFETPAMVMGGSGIDSITKAVAARIEFVALRDAVWQAADPVAAVRASMHLLGMPAEATS